MLELELMTESSMVVEVSSMSVIEFVLCLTVEIAMG